MLIADEPTTGLDVTTQKTVMDLIVELTKQRGMSTILITHDLGLAATYCDRVAVMEKGHVVESALSRQIFTAPSHAYTRKLMRATPRPGASLRDLLPEDDPAAAPAAAVSVATDGKAGAPLLVVEKLVKEYPRKGMAGGFKKIFQRKPAPVPEVFRAVPFDGNHARIPGQRCPGQLLAREITGQFHLPPAGRSLDRNGRNPRGSRARAEPGSHTFARAP